eukprot:9382676-Prorocentrum_lima.AAC.1
MPFVQGHSPYARRRESDCSLGSSLVWMKHAFAQLSKPTPPRGKSFVSGPAADATTALACCAG